MRCRRLSCAAWCSCRRLPLRYWDKRMRMASFCWSHTMGCTGTLNRSLRAIHTVCIRRCCCSKGGITRPGVLTGRSGRGWKRMRRIRCLVWMHRHSGLIWRGGAGLGGGIHGDRTVLQCGSSRITIPTPLWPFAGFTFSFLTGVLCNNNERSEKSPEEELMTYLEPNLDRTGT